MALLCPWQVYLPRPEDPVELRLQQQLGPSKHYPRFWT